LKKFFETGAVSGIQPEHSRKLQRILMRLNSTKTIDDIDLFGFRLHPLKGDLKGLWSEQYRLIGELLLNLKMKIFI
jgi:proteic killer suppression protein